MRSCLVWGIRPLARIVVVGLAIAGTVQAQDRPVDVGEVPAPSGDASVRPDEAPVRKPLAPDGTIPDDVTRGVDGPIDPYGVFLRHRMRLQDCVLRMDAPGAWAELRSIEEQGFHRFVDRRHAFETILRIDPADEEARVALGKARYRGPIERFHGRFLEWDEYLEARDEALGLEPMSAGSTDPAGTKDAPAALEARRRIEELDRARREVASEATLRAGIARLETLLAFVDDTPVSSASPSAPSGDVGAHDDFAASIRALLVPARREAARLTFSEARQWILDHPDDAPGGLDRLEAARLEWFAYAADAPKEERRAVQTILREVLALEDIVLAEWFASGEPERDTPWVALLPFSASGVSWQGDDTTTIEDDRIVLGQEGEASSPRLAITAIGTRERWLHYDLEFDVVVLSKGFDLLTRYDPVAPFLQAGLRAPSRPGDTGRVQEGRTHRVQQFVRGGTTRLLVDGVVVENATIPPAVRHGGGVGFALQPGARIEVRNLRVRVFR